MLAYYLRPYHPGSHEVHFASKSRKDWLNFHIADIRDPEALEEVVEAVEPDVIINTAVLGEVSKCEEDPELAEEINHLAHGNVISLCGERDIKPVYISTSSVFSGRKGNYVEGDAPHPTTVYGRTKLRGEEATRRGADQWAIFRVTAIFGDCPWRQDFIRKTAHGLRAGRTLELWEQVISPSYGPFVADAMMRLIGKGVNGIWHIAGEEQLSRYEIGKILMRQLEERGAGRLKGGRGRSAAQDPEAGSGRILKVKTPEGLPRDRSLCVGKLKRELPGLEFPDFGSTVRHLLSGPESRESAQISR